MTPTLNDFFNDIAKILDAPTRPNPRPRTSWQETSQAFIFTTSIPGIPPNDIQVSNTGSIIFIKTPLEEITIPLPTDIDGTTIAPRLKYGVLTISIRKGTPRNPHKLIPVIEE